ncbi:hypothetical protein A1O7_06619 [Cladophialophora yegresii CBS 114405]|uniref:Uncharacterized protein n=1 Tax=Cladophialophora yegresii CBS 114405 TaxID=1182544 RepID=W9VTW2_9EURO|nr:uncharacterized protein A1O7_06619 [Cladophialophora yegresii CBS 114405]EXJ59187.1 hypothetical protein A1O7_06619 [Cladophialophora yegresii CBS 114405]
MQSQDSPPRHLRNVPGFRDLRIGSPTSWRSSLHRRQLNGESHSDLYELLDTLNTESDQNTTAGHPDTRVENGQLYGEPIYAETIVGQPAVPRSQRLVGSSEETLTAQPFRRAAIWKELWFPLLCIHGSMLLILGTLAVLVSVYRVKPQRGLFFDPIGWTDSRQRAYILLNVPATWLTFVTGRATQIAGLLSGFLMQLWTWKTAQSMAEASKLPKADELPTPYQLSLLIGMLLASPDRLRRYVSYRCFRQQRKKAPRSPGLLLQAGLMLSVCFLMATLMFSADTLVHYTTETIQYDQVRVDSIVQGSGRGLSEQCLSVKREENFGFPCSINNLISNEAFLAEHNEMLFLYHNSSQTSEIRVVASDVGDMALLLPKTQSLSPYVDYRASTIGITSQCKPVTTSCNFDVWGPEDLYSGFYCSPNFWGSLGGSETNVSVPGTDYPALAFKVDSNILLAFFMDEGLTEPYNPFGYNPDTGAPDPNIPLMPDSQLINKVYVAFATRFASTAVLANADLSLDAGFFKGPNPVYDSVIACSYQSLHVEYNWFNGSIRDLETTPAPNGTISEIWHGGHISSSVSGTSATLQTILKQAAVQNSSTAFAQTWASLYSPVIMATIGGLSSPRANLLQQTRVPMLVIKVSIPALVFLGWCCLAYIAVGCTLAVLAVRTASRGDVRDAKVRLTLFGLVAWAVAAAGRRGHGGGGGLLPREQDIGEEDDRVGLLQGRDGSFYFKVISGGDKDARTRINPSAC